MTTPPGDTAPEASDDPGPGAAGDGAAPSPTPADGGATGRRRGRRREAVGRQLRRLIEAIRDENEERVTETVLALSQRSRWLAPLAMVVGAFAMLFQGLKLLVIEWRLTLIQILPAMWIWLAMLDLKIHALRDRSFNVLRGPVLVPIVLAIAVITAASFYLNAVFAFAIDRPGKPDIRSGFARARIHLRTILVWGFVVGVALGFATAVVTRWGKLWFAATLSVVVGVMMVAYVAVPARLTGVKSERSARDKLAATAIGGAIGALVCSPPYALGRVAILMLGSHTFRVLAVVMLVVAVVLQTGATTSIKAIKMSAKLAVGRPVTTDGDPPDQAPAGG